MTTVAGDGVTLRLWRASDVDVLVKACNDAAIVRFLTNIPSPYTEEAARQWTAEGAPAAWRAGGAAFAVTDPSTAEVVGGVGLGNLQTGRRQAEVGFWVAPWARGRGVATAATKTITNWALEQGFHRIELLAAKENPASQRIAFAAGFTREGVRRDAGPLRDGGWCDLVAFARLVDDEPGPTTRLLPDLPGGFLTDGVVRLRRLGPGDVQDFFALNQFPEVAHNHLGEPITMEQAQLRCHRTESAWLAGERADCVIEDAATGAFAGDIGLFYNAPYSSQAILGYALRPEFRGKGFCTRAVNLICDWAFEHAGIVRVIAGTFPENELSRRVLQRAGFEREGFLKAALPGRDGKRIDDIQFVRISPLVHPS